MGNDTRLRVDEEIRDIEFAVGFYDALGAGKSFEKAFEFGKMRPG